MWRGVRAPLYSLGGIQRTIVGRRVPSCPRIPGWGIRLESTKSQQSPQESTAIGKTIVELVDEMEQQSRSQTHEDLVRVQPVRFGDADHVRPDLARLRVVPRDSSFFMANPPHEEIVWRLNDLVQRYLTLPVVPLDEYVPSKWISFDEYKTVAGGQRLKQSQYDQFTSLARRLDMIEAQLMPTEVEQVLGQLRRDSVGSALGGTTVKRHEQLDEQGRAVAVGRRKTASSRVMVSRAQIPGEGLIFVNGRSLDEFAASLLNRQKIVYPLRVIDSIGEYNVWATVHGGGVTAQTEAVAHGLALALRIHNPLLGPRLKKAGCTKRDLRVKERKKPGLAKARKAYTWVKR